MKKIIVEEADRIGIIAFNRRERRNAFDRDMISQIIHAIENFQQTGVRVLLLKSQSSGKVWSAGYDMNDLPEDQTLLTGVYSSPFDTLLRTLGRFPGPVIAMVSGSVWGGACEIVLSCDLAVGDETCSFAATPAKIGLPYSTRGIARYLKRLPLHVVKEMFFTGRPIPADLALRFQILNHVVTQKNLEPFTFELAREMSCNAPLTLKVIKEQTRILSDAIPISPEAFEYLEDLRRSVFESRDFREGCRAFREKRNPVFLGE